jgi:hypothetical protein
MEVQLMHPIKSLADTCRCGLYNTEIHSIYYLKIQSDAQKFGCKDTEIVFICY